MALNSSLCHPPCLHAIPTCLNWHGKKLFFLHCYHCNCRHTAYGSSSAAVIIRPKHNLCCVYSIHRSMCMQNPLINCPILFHSISSRLVFIRSSISSHHITLPRSLTREGIMSHLLNGGKIIHTHNVKLVWIKMRTAFLFDFDFQFDVLASTSSSMSVMLI